MTDKSKRRSSARRRIEDALQLVMLPDDPTPLAHQADASAWGVDELNLVDVPFAPASSRIGPEGDGQSTREVNSVHITPDGKIVKRGWTLIAGPDGLPTASTEQTLVALLKLAAERTNFLTEVVTFNPLELLRIMGVEVDNGRYRERLLRDLQILLGMRIQFRRSWFDRRKGQYIRETNLSIIQTFQRTEPVLGRPRELAADDPDGSWVIRWNTDFFQSLSARYIKRLDTDLFFRLRPLAAKLYRILDKAAFGKVAGDDVEFFLEALVANLVMAQDKPYEIKRRLQSALDELIKVEILSAYSYEEIDVGPLPGWWVRFTIGRRIARPPRPALSSGTPLRP